MASSSSVAAFSHTRSSASAASHVCWSTIGGTAAGWLLSIVFDGGVIGPPCGVAHLGLSGVLTSPELRTHRSKPLERSDRRLAAHELSWSAPRALAPRILTRRWHSNGQSWSSRSMAGRSRTVSRWWPRRREGRRGVHGHPRNQLPHDQTPGSRVVWRPRLLGGRASKPCEPPDPPSYIWPWRTGPAGS